MEKFVCLLAYSYSDRHFVYSYSGESLEDFKKRIQKCYDNCRERTIIPLTGEEDMF